LISFEVYTKWSELKRSDLISRKKRPNQFAIEGSQLLGMLRNPITSLFLYFKTDEDENITLILLVIFLDYLFIVSMVKRIYVVIISSSHQTIFIGEDRFQGAK
jgi:hypothetical protein